MTTRVADEGRRERRRASVRSLTNDGRSAREIAAILDVTTRTVNRDRSALGIAQPRAPFITDETKARIKRLAEDGCSAREIARTVGCTETSAAKHGGAWTREQQNEWMSILIQTGTHKPNKGTLS